MSRFDDDEDMRDRADEQLLAGAELPADRPLADLLGELRATATGPLPAPNPRLAAVLRDGLPPQPVPVPVEVPSGDRPAASTSARLLRWAAGLGVAAKIALGAGVAVAAVTGAAELPGVPEQVSGPARGIVEGVTGWVDGHHAIPGPTATASPRPTSAPSDAPAEPSGVPSSPGRLPTTAPAPAPTEGGPVAPRAPVDEGSSAPAPTTRPAPQQTSEPGQSPTGRPATEDGSDGQGPDGSGHADRGLLPTSTWSTFRVPIGTGDPGRNGDTAIG